MTAPNLTQYQTAERALATREARTAIRTHATVYAVVIPILVVVNLLAVPEFLWFEFPMLGWGAGLLAHYWFGFRGVAEQTTRRQGLVTLAATQS